MERIPLRPLPSDTLQITVEGIPYKVRTRYNSREARWRFDLLTVTGTPIVQAQKLVHGVNLTGRFADERLPSKGNFWCIDRRTYKDIPEYFLKDVEDNLQIWYITTEEYNEFFS